MEDHRYNPTIKKSHKDHLTIGIVSLSGGFLGDPQNSHQLNLVKKRLISEFGLEYKFMPHALMGSGYLSSHPEARASDLFEAFSDKSVDIIWSAIGGDDTYRIIPFLNDDAFKKLISKNPKPFIGFSDTTINHLFLYRLGLNTIYGPAILSDFGELSQEMLPYTKQEIKSLLSGEVNHSLTQSQTWYLERNNFSASQLGTDRIKRPEVHGMQFINGHGSIKGELIGGCIESICGLLPTKDHAPAYGTDSSRTILPELSAWQNKVLFLETSEERPSPESFKTMLEQITTHGIFDKVAAVLFAKPIDETYYDEYLSLLSEVSTNFKLPLVANLNFGHSAPRTFLPYGQEIIMDFKNQSLRLPKPIIHFV